MTSIRLVLRDGSVFYGLSFGAEKPVAGEVVFNTGMVGYPESMTDPSYHGQIVVFTYPLVGNYGVPPEEYDKKLSRFFESDRIHVKGIVISDYSKDYSHWNASRSLEAWMKRYDIPGIYGVDTRELTKKLRRRGTMLGKIVNDFDISFIDPNRRNLVAEVSIGKPEVYGDGRTTIMVIDCGLKQGIIRSLVQRDVKVVRVPWDYDIFSGEYDLDGLLISNGPGDPKMCKKTIYNIREALRREIPTFGICLGNQLLALAAGADTYKLKYGHRSQNQPCVEVGTKRCYITSQNHGYAVDNKTLPKGWVPWFVNANDGTNEGIRHKHKQFMSVQFHPEAQPGPVDTGYLFDRFIEMIV
jgi:carbamoyl-phosphate synthase small subunit